MTGCLEEQGLRDFLTGRLDAPSLSAATDHVEGCSACQERLDSLTHRPSLVLDGLSAENRKPAAPADAGGTLLANRYRLRETLGEGGMGTVWAADQTAPVRRAVAVKVIKAGLGGRAVLHRFEAERQALARMDHPNIARVLDGGETADGRPFFVMELVAGRPLSEYCDEARLDVRGRLELFATVCRAVQHAHQKGVVHRDLKPSNILVATVDGKPAPKVIDFGVAKAVVDERTDESPTTQDGAVVGTLDYMSPEQAGGPAADIDTRSDIYSLGVVLFELLTGLRPLDTRRPVGLGDILRMIQEEEPAKPSTRVSAADTLVSAASLRQTEPRRLVSQLRGDLDWVVMKCLEKPRDRRYESASALARDIERFLADEPVEARPPSASYRLRKFLRRNKGTAIAASLVLIVLIAGLAATKWQAIEAEHARANEAAQRVVAETNEQKAKAAAEKERVARLAEERQRNFAEAISRFLQDDVLALTSVEFQRRMDDANKFGLTKDSTLRDLLDRAAAKLKARTDLDPRTEAQLCWIIGASYENVGEARKAVGFLERDVQIQTQLHGRDHPDTLRAMNWLGRTYASTDRLDLALSLDEETFRGCKAQFGPKNKLTLSSMANLASDYAAVQKFDLATPLFEEALAGKKSALGPDHPDTLICMVRLAGIHVAAKKPEMAVPLYEYALPLLTAEGGADDVHTMTCAHNLALAYQRVGRLEEAIPIFEKTLERQKTKLGLDHPQTLDMMNSLGAAYRAAGRLSAAIPILEQALAGWKARNETDDPKALACMGQLAASYELVGRLDQAASLFEEVYAIRRTKYGPDHDATIKTMYNLASAYVRGRQFDKSIALLEEALKQKTGKSGRYHVETLGVAANLGLNYREAGRPAEAIPLLEEAHRAAKRFPALRWVGPHLLEAYAKAGESEKFANLLQEQLAEIHATPPADSLQRASRLNRIGIILLDQKQWTEAEAPLREAFTILAKTRPDDWQTFSAQSLLGTALLGRKQFADAERLLQAGYEGMKSREQLIPPQDRPRLTECVARLVELYEATNRPDDAAQWRKGAEERRKP